MMISNFININRIICFLFSIILTITNSNTKTPYILHNKVDCYELKFYNKNGEDFFSKSFAQKPVIIKVDDSLYKIIQSTGSNSNYTFFVNVVDASYSETYFNLLYHDNEKAVFLKNNIIYVTELFDSQNILAIIKRDFSITAVPQSAIMNLEIVDDTIYINYLSGPTFEEVNEEIPLK